MRVKIRFIFCWNHVPFLTRKKYFYPRTFFLSLHPTLLLFLFLLVIIKIQENQPTWNKLKNYIIQISLSYICASYHSSFSILSGYGIMFIHLSRKSDSKKSFGIFRTSEYSATSELHNFLKEVQNEILKTLPIRFPFLIILHCYWFIS